MRYLYWLVCLFMFSSAQAQMIRGRVMEKADDMESPLAGANVYWAGTTKGVVTDANGEFKIKWDAGGRLVASFIGYQADTLTVSADDRFVQFFLFSGEQLDEVSVEARKQSTVMTTRGAVIEQIITGTELMKAACCNLGESFETNASVDVSYADAVTGAKQIQLLGLTGKYVQMLTENMPNFKGLASLFGLSYVPGPWMSSISVSKGTSSVINGYESMAGQISVDYKKPTDPEMLYANFFTSSEGMYEGNTNFSFKLSDKWSTMFFLHGDWMEEGHDGNGDGFLDMPKKTQYNLMNRWAYKDETWFLQFGGKFVSEDRLGGQGGHGAHAASMVESDLGLYQIGIDTRRYEAFLKLGYLMPQYEYTTMALIVNFSDHSQDSYYGLKQYDARQQSLFLNYIYQSIFGTNPNQKFSAGLSFNYDKFDEDFQDRIFVNGEGQLTDQVNFSREERVPGVFFQYTGDFWDQRFTLMLGLRYDYHNIYGSLFTPRLHLVYRPTDMTSLKLSVGRGSRAANILAENSNLLASAASIYVNGKLLADHVEELSTLKMEDAWNVGVNWNQKFDLWGRVFNLNLDYYHTRFAEQVIVDNESDYSRVNFYNLDGKSYSNCYQAEVKYELIPRLEATLAYRYNDVKYTVNGKLQSAPLTNRYKGLVSLSYFTNLKKWQFDFTTQFNGYGRIPDQGGIEDEYRVASRFDAFQLMNAQVTKYFRLWSVYVGCENIGDFTQKNPIVDAGNPWGSHFDSSKVWGPLHGRKFYLGLRFSLDRK
ncbi:MAG: TonB-dependent receptor [Marinifilaceae bacterium]|nr:TonB-dependent receptor [Marinifilaceae bacterium]